MPKSTLNSIRILLVEPAGPLNVGAIARVMKNLGLWHLVLVNPQCDHLGAEARQMAVHAADVLEAAQVVGTLVEGLQGCQRAIATTARSRTLTAALEHPRVALPWLLEASSSEISGALIFGPEDRGLSNEELNYAQRFVFIPTSPEYASLNLAQAVAICCYELRQSFLGVEGGGEAEREEGEDPARVSLLPPPYESNLPSHIPAPPNSCPAPLEEVEAFYQHLEAVLLRIGYLYPHTAESRMQKFRRLFSRALPSNTEVAMLRGILSQVEWLAQNSLDDK